MTVSHLRNVAEKVFILGIAVVIALYGSKLVVTKLKKYHKKEIRMRHPGDKCIEFSSYTSCQGHYSITLRSESCLCNACHRDCLRSCGKPRWLVLAKHAVCKHCFVCCDGPSSCTCDSVCDWGPTQCLDESESELKRWIECTM